MTTYDLILPEIPDDVELLETKALGKKWIWENTGNDSWYNEDMDSEVTLKHLLYHYGPLKVVEKQYEIWCSEKLPAAPFTGTLKECNYELQQTAMKAIKNKYRLVEFSYSDGWFKIVNPYDLEIEPVEYRVIALDSAKQKG